MFNDNLFMVVDAGCKRGGFPRFSAELVAEMWADRIVDGAGFLTEDDHVLSRHEPIDRLFPTAEELRSRGVDVALLAACLQENLIVREYFAETVQNLTVDELNGALEHLLEGSDAIKAHPHDALDRAMHLQGCCGCQTA